MSISEKVSGSGVSNFSLEERSLYHISRKKQKEMNGRR
jgi:hypothetical protein